MKYAVLTLCVALLVAGCGGIGGNSGPSGEFYTPTGNDGLLLIGEDLPGDIFEKENFDVLYILENRGVANASNVYLTPQYDPQYLEFVAFVAPPRSQIDLDEETIILDTIRAADQYGPGETQYVHVQYRAIPITRGAGSIDTAVSLHVCYDYSTNVSAEVCIEQDRLREANQAACRASSVRPGSNGAPIVIEEVLTRTTLIPDGADGLRPSPSFRIKIRDAGKGLTGIACLDDPRTTERNQEGEHREDKIFNQVKIEAFMLTEQLDCGTGVVRLNNKRGEILCRVSEDTELLFGEGNYESLININVAYAYRDSVVTDVVVRNG